MPQAANASSGVSVDNRLVENPSLVKLEAERQRISGIIQVVFAAIQAGRSVKAALQTGNAGNWKFGEFKSITKWQNQMTKRGWTPEQITEALNSKEFYQMVNKVNPGNPALRYVHPTTKKSVVIDTVTNEILQIGGEGFVW